MNEKLTIEVEQVDNGFIVDCSIHGKIYPEPGKVWVSHLTANVAASTHAIFAFHGKGAR